MIEHYRISEHPRALRRRKERALVSRSTDPRPGAKTHALARRRDGAFATIAGVKGPAMSVAKGRNGRDADGAKERGGGGGVEEGTRKKDPLTSP